MHKGWQAVAKEHLEKLSSQEQEDTMTAMGHLLWTMVEDRSNHPLHQVLLRVSAEGDVQVTAVFDKREAPQEVEARVDE